MSSSGSDASTTTGALLGALAVAAVASVGTLSGAAGPSGGTAEALAAAAEDVFVNGKKRKRCPWGGCGTDHAHLGNLVKHIRVHTSEKPFVCDVPGCGKAFVSSSNLATHVRTHTSEKPFVCGVPDCGKAFSGSNDLAKHKRTHTGDKPFVCGVPGCGKAFSESGSLASHVRTHTGERPFVCDVPGCGKAFACSSNLTQHARTHTGDKPFVCDVPGCGKAFAGSGALTSHARTHTGERPYKCTFAGCGKAFAKTGNLAVHARRHTGDKPFKCAVVGCGKAFSTSGNLTSHVRIHTGEKPYKCTVAECGKEFAHKCALVGHTRIHFGEKPYKCMVGECGATFVTSKHLAVHTTTAHTPAGMQRKKLQEQKMHEALVLGGYTENFKRGQVPAPGEFTREVYFDHRCALARNFMPGEKKFAYVDFVVRTHDGRLVFLEVDEDQHSHYPQLCETTRMWNICESIALADLGADINVFWMRVNPDRPFEVAGTRVHSPPKERFGKVVKFLDALKAGPEDPPMQVAYAFYDCDDSGRPLVLCDPDYQPDVVPAVVLISDEPHFNELSQPRELPELEEEDEDSLCPPCDENE